MNIKFHTAANGETGYANHARAFWSRLQNVSDGNGVPIHIVLDTSDHPMFYTEYDGIKICYNVYESTLQPERFFNHIKDNWDYFWCPSNWQRECMIAQGFPAARVHVVPEGVDGNEFFPIENSALADDNFTFIIIGKWEYRKSTQEMIDSWFETFPIESYPDIRLILSVDNPFDQKNVQNKLKEIENRYDPRVKIVHFPARAEYIRLLQSSHCFLSCSRSEGWNLPLIEAIACGIPSICSNNSAQVDFAKNISYLVDTKHLINPIPTGFPGEYYEPDFEIFKSHMRHIYQNWNECRQRALIGSNVVRQKFSWENAVTTAVSYLLDIEQNYKSSKKEESIIDIKDEVVIDDIIGEKEKDSINVTFIDGAKFELSGDSGVEYLVKFIDTSRNQIVYQTELTPLREAGICWAAPSPKYFIPWKIEATPTNTFTQDSDTIVIKNRSGEIREAFKQELNPSGQRVFINLESKALGDNLAWVPYLEEFRKKWGCTVIATTFWNEIFIDAYPEIEFVRPGSVVHNLYAQYRIGCYDNDYSRNRNNWREIPLQKVAADALGLQYSEIRPRVDVKQSFVRTGRKYVCISDHSTMQAKYWNFPGGWQAVVDYLWDVGYDVVAVSKDPTDLKKILPINNKPIEETISILNGCEFFIGVGSGLSWLAWALGKKVIMISGFSDPFTEFTIDNYRLSPPPKICHGCFNDATLTFDRSWDWCPRNKNFECSKTITPEMVKEKIDLLISHL